MKAVGIIAEYNPLHNGHLYHIEEAKRLAGSDAVVVAMSGDYVQRGEPAILDKWERTELALQHGADIVVEIPTLFCLGNAMQYGRAGIRILESMAKVKYLAFGSESGDIEELARIAANINSKQLEMDRIISELSKSGYSYPRARAVAYSELFDDSKGRTVLEGSNDILALEYLKACKRLKPVAVKRVGADYNDELDVDVEYQSATAIRSALRDRKDITDYVPMSVSAAIEQAKYSDHLTFSDDWMNTLKYAVMSMTAEEIDACPSGGEGLGNRIKSMIADAKTWDDFIESVKSKRYTHTRISRLCMQIILGINRDYFLSSEPEYVRILGFTKKGRDLISEMSHDESLPLITNINKQRDLVSAEGIKQLELDIHAADIYNLVTGRDQVVKSDFRMIPVMTEK
ncbi:MAG: nucleotidyltransferase [Clostridiales bacterium]|nr:nucleotidyltransferase [Candidatus Crickella equi]